MMEDNIKQTEKTNKPMVLIIGEPSVCKDYISKYLKGRHENFEILIVDKANISVNEASLIEKHQSIIIEEKLKKSIDVEEKFKKSIELVNHEPLIDICTNPHHRKHKKWQPNYKFHK